MDRLSISRIFLTYYCIYVVILSIVIATPAEAKEATHSKSGGEVVNEHPYTYDVQTSNGPHNWGKLNASWQICNNGKFQSPIDINEKIVVVDSSLGNLKVVHKPALAEVVNRGHDIMLAWTADAGGIIINNKEYKLKQSHWHSPSEHTLNGKKLDMEFHMVHQDEDGNIAVISSLYQLGEPNHFLAKFLGVIQSSSVSNEGTEVGTIDPSDASINITNYYRYTGSLTTPPCTEGVIWTIMQKVGSVSSDQISSMKQAVDDIFENNARPPQALNGRMIYLHTQ